MSISRPRMVTAPRTISITSRSRLRCRTSGGRAVVVLDTGNRGSRVKKERKQGIGCALSRFLPRPNPPLRSPTYPSAPPAHSLHPSLYCQHIGTYELVLFPCCSIVEPKPPHHSSLSISPAKLSLSPLRYTLASSSRHRLAPQTRIIDPDC